MRAPRGERIALAVMSAVAVAVLVTAFLLAPDARGHGTHERLGLPPCGLLQMTGIPCPSCGYTTAFAHAVRLELGAAARVQPMGLVLAAATAAIAVAGPIYAIRGTPVLERLTAPLGTRTGLYLIFAILAAWAYKIIAMRTSGGGA